MVAQGAANRVHSFFIQRVYAGNAADSIRTKKFSHDLVVSTWYLVFSNCSPVANVCVVGQLAQSGIVFFTSAVNLPCATCAEISEPAASCDTSFTNAPLASKTRAYPRSRIFTGESALSCAVSRSTRERRAAR